jgi:hypothetical protein
LRQVVQAALRLQNGPFVRVGAHWRNQQAIQQVIQRVIQQAIQQAIQQGNQAGCGFGIELSR